MFVKNAYPAHIFESVLNKFLTGLHTSSRSDDIQSSTPANEDLKTLVLPYLGQVSNLLRHQLQSLCKRFNVKCRVVFKPFKVSNYFTLKSRCPSALRSMIVYQFSCSRDESITYIGKTKRHLVSRVKEHTTPSANPSAVFQHIGTCNCTVTLDSFNILQTCVNDYDLAILEALYIRELKPTLNSSLTGQG